MFLLHYKHCNFIEKSAFEKYVLGSFANYILSDEITEHLWSVAFSDKKLLCSISGS